MAKRWASTFVRELDSVAQNLGYEPARQRRCGHPSWFHPVSRQTVFSSSTPSDHRTWKNAVSELRRRAAQGVMSRQSAATG